MPPLMLISAMAALLWAFLWHPDPDRPIAFGPFLAFGFWVVWQIGPRAFG